MTVPEPSMRGAFPARFLIRTAAVSAVALGVGAGALRWMLARDLGAEFRAAHYTLKGLLGFVGPALLFCAVSVVLVGSVGVLLVAVLASHKVAGPLFRLQRVAGYLERGTLPGRVHLRAGDQGTGFAAELNRWMDRVKERVRAEQQAAGRADEALQGYLEAVAARRSDRAREALRELAAQARGGADARKGPA